MSKSIYCSRCFSFGHSKHECQKSLPPVDFFIQEIDNRVTTILDQNKNFADSEDEFSPYQKLSADNNLKSLPINYNLPFTNQNYQDLATNDEKRHKLIELGNQLSQIYETHLKPTEREADVRFWSIYKMARIIEEVCLNSICAPQGSSLNGTFLASSDVDLLVFNIDKNRFENFFKKLESKVSEKTGNLREIIGDLKFCKRKRVSFISCVDLETGIRYEIIPGSVGGILCANRMKKFFQKFENLNLKTVSILVKSFINCIEGGKVFTGGFSSTMILQLCQFVALNHRCIEKVDFPLLFIEILDFLSNLDNYKDVVICASSGRGEFFVRPDNLKGKPFLVMMDSTEKNSLLMGNISEKTQFISDQSRLFLRSFENLFLTGKSDLVSLFPGFSIDFHCDENVLNEIFEYKTVDANLAVINSQTIRFDRKFIESNKLFLLIDKNDEKVVSNGVIKFCVDFFRPESIFEWRVNDDIFDILKYDQRYSISVDVILELENKDEPGTVKKFDTESFIKEFPSFDINTVCEHESYIKTNVT